MQLKRKIPNHNRLKTWATPNLCICQPSARSCLFELVRLLARLLNLVNQPCHIVKGPLNGQSLTSLITNSTIINGLYQICISIGTITPHKTREDKPVIIAQKVQTNNTLNNAYLLEESSGPRVSQRHSKTFSNTSSSLVLLPKKRGTPSEPILSEQVEQVAHHRKKVEVSFINKITRKRSKHIFGFFVKPKVSV